MLLRSQSDLDLGHTKTDVSCGTSMQDGEQLCSFILKFIQKYRSYGRVKVWPSNVTLTLGLPEQMFQMAHLLLIENNCANSYWNPSKIVGVMIRTKIWPSSVTLGLTEQMFQMAHLHMKENSCIKLFWNPSAIVEVMVETNSDGCTHALMHTYTGKCHCDNYVSLTASGLDKKAEDSKGHTNARKIPLLSFWWVCS